MLNGRRSITLVQILSLSLSSFTTSIYGPSDWRTHIRSKRRKTLDITNLEMPSPRATLDITSINKLMDMLKGNPLTDKHIRIPILPNCTWRQALISPKCLDLISKKLIQLYTDLLKLGLIPWKTCVLWNCLDLKFCTSAQLTVGFILQRVLALFKKKLWINPLFDKRGTKLIKLFMLFW